MKKIIFLSVFIYFTSIMTMAQTPTAFEMNQRLGRGINMGNAFEAPTETEWGNPWDPEYFKIIAELGFSHVRIPIRWDTPERSMDIPPYTIEPAFLDRIKLAVDVALRNGLHPIINMHHHNTLFENPQQERARFIAQWVQISQFFRNYPDSLIFEVMNEPHSNLTPALWNEFFAEALTTIRQTNPTRVVLLGTAAMGGLSAVRYLQIPNDPNLILTLHYYEPFQFTHQGASWVSGADAWLGTRWRNTDSERQTIINEFSYAIEFARRHNIPVHIGEFGAYSPANLDDRVRYTNFLARWFEEQGFSWAYWEFSARFGIYDPRTRQFIQPLVDALLRNPMLPAATVQGTTVLDHNFSSGTTGWALNAVSPGRASMAIVQDRVNFNITNGGTEGWHVQFGRGGVPLIQGAMYRVTFSARSYQSPRDVVAYVGLAASPWTAYSGHSNFTVSTDEREYSFTFTMGSPNNANARLVFDLGRSAIGLSISWIRIERLSIVQSIGKSPSSNIKIYPNPANTVLNIANADNYQTLSVFDMKGRLLMREQMFASHAAVNIQNLPSGMHILSLESDHHQTRLQFMKID